MQAADPATAMWQKAQEDLVLARRSLVGREKIVWGACFHAQQAAEKALKLFLLKHDKEPKRSHDLLEVLGQRLQVRSSFSFLESFCVFLNPMSVNVRYSDELELGVKDARQAIRAAEKVVRFVGQAIELKDSK
jgi:HEPN domain-containing protein